MCVIRVTQRQNTGLVQNLALERKKKEAVVTELDAGLIVSVFYWKS